MGGKITLAGRGEMGGRVSLAERGKIVGLNSLAPHTYPQFLELSAPGGAEEAWPWWQTDEEPERDAAILRRLL